MALVLLCVASCSDSTSKAGASFVTVGTIDGQNLVESVHAFTASMPPRWDYAFTFVSDRCAEFWHHDVAEFQKTIEPTAKTGVISDLNIAPASTAPDDRTVVTFRWGADTVTEAWVKQSDGHWRLDDCGLATSSTSPP
jgi:hypothetical protein